MGIVSTSISFGGEHEYLLIMVHEFNINQDIPIKHPIILMVDLRNINFNVNYNNSDIQNNHRNLFGIKFFYGFKQNRFKLQCGFGGFQLPPLSKKAHFYQQSKYIYNEQLKQQQIHKRNILKHRQQKQLKKNLLIPSESNGVHPKNNKKITNKKKKKKKNGQNTKKKKKKKKK